MKNAWPVVGLMTVILACSPATETIIDREADRAAIEEILREASVANQSGDVEAWLGNLTDDAVVMYTGQPPMEGIPTLREWIVERFATANVQVTITPVEIVVDHDLAFNRTHVTGYEVSLETGDTLPVDYKEIAILRRQPDGGWLVSRLIGNSNLPG